jgi:hypothetical protein
MFLQVLNIQCFIVIAPDLYHFFPFLKLEIDSCKLLCSINELNFLINLIKLNAHERPCIMYHIILYTLYPLSNFKVFKGSKCCFPSSSSSSSSS